MHVPVAFRPWSGAGPGVVSTAQSGEATVCEVESTDVPPPAGGYRRP
ncbi:MAG: hypothetical protein M0T71_10435 [Actinomycetota bacterium]|nr:hypothetical protein [Actinomycetota bacterium]